jgi:hypothetical protein
MDIEEEQSERLRQRRDASAVRLLSAGGSVADFLDLASLNATLDEVRHTSDVFAALLRSDRDLARRCLHLALPTLIAVQDVALLRQLKTECRDVLRESAQRLNYWPAFLGDDGRVKDWATRSVASCVRQVEYVHQLIGEPDDMNTLRAFALSLIEPKDLRDRVAGRLAATPTDGASRLVEIR